MKSGNLNFLEDSEPLQDCNGTDLPFLLLRFSYIIYLNDMFRPFLGSYSG